MKVVYAGLGIPYRWQQWEVGTTIRIPTRQGYAHKAQGSLWPQAKSPMGPHRHVTFLQKTPGWLYFFHHFNKDNMCILIGYSMDIVVLHDVPYPNKGLYWEHQHKPTGGIIGNQCPPDLTKLYLY